jgi:hypothetical protein
MSPGGGSGSRRSVAASCASDEGSTLWTNLKWPTARGNCASSEINGGEIDAFEGGGVTSTLRPPLPCILCLLHSMRKAVDATLNGSVLGVSLAWVASRVGFPCRLCKGHPRIAVLLLEALGTKRRPKSPFSLAAPLCGWLSPRVLLRSPRVCDSERLLLGRLHTGVVITT